MEEFKIRYYSSKVLKSKEKLNVLPSIQDLQDAIMSANDEIIDYSDSEMDSLRDRNSLMDAMFDSFLDSTVMLPACQSALESYDRGQIDEENYRKQREIIMKLCDLYRENPMPKEEIFNQFRELEKLGDPPPRLISALDNCNVM
ncbi:hypothetical protein ACOME3_004294 [Neoechinorhynchus agilis]